MRCPGSLLLVVLALAGLVRATEVSYANDAAQLLSGARSPALAGVALGLSPDASAWNRTPSHLAGLEHPEISLHHASLYQGIDAEQTEAYLALPLEQGTVLGVGLGRVGVDGILEVGEDEDPDFDNTFSAADWTASLGLGRAWFSGRLQAGGVVKFLAREIDQWGFGLQTDASLVWADPTGWRAGMRFDRGFGSFVAWEEGRREFSPADLEIGAGFEKALPYFYGTGSLAWESAGLVQAESQASFTTDDARPWSDPWLALRASRLAGEFRFDFGGVLRAGAEIQSLVRLTDFLQGQDEQGLYGESRGLVSFGVGYLWQERLRVDYALVDHPETGISHRVSLGLVFGPRAAVSVRSRSQTDSVPTAPSAGSEAREGDPAAPGVDDAPKPAPAAPEKAAPAADDEWDAPETTAP